MTARDRFQALNLSRRRLISGAGLIAAGGTLLGAGLGAEPAAAQSKVAQKLVSYQDAPKGAARCDKCTQWQPPASCKVVQGAIKPTGWCSLFAPKT